MDKIKETQQSLADCVFCLAAQNALNRQNTLRLIEQLRSDTGASSADGTLTDVSLTLLMALFYCLDVRLLETQDSEGMKNLFMLMVFVIQSAFVLICLCMHPH